MPGNEDLSKAKDLELVEKAFNAMDRGELEEYVRLLEDEEMAPNEALYKMLQGKDDVLTDEFDAAIQHAGRDWFANGDGYITDDEGRQQVFWQGYDNPQLVEGYVSDALAEAVRRAIDAYDPTSTQHWPIDMWMQCGYSVFKVLVTWKKLGEGDADGLVTVTFLVPDTAMRVRVARRDVPLAESGAADFGDNLYPSAS